MLSVPALASIAAARSRLGGVERIPSGGSERWRPQQAVAEARGEDLPWLAARFALAGDLSSYWPLWFRLTLQAVRIGSAQSWPADVATLNGSRKLYIGELARLVLEEERHAALFAADPVALRAACLGVSARVWTEQLTRPHRSITSVFLRWRSAGLALVQSAILGLKA